MKGYAYNGSFKIIEREDHVAIFGFSLEKHCMLSLAISYDDFNLLSICLEKDEDWVDYLVANGTNLF